MDPASLATAMDHNAELPVHTLAQLIA
jgi:hypothetical protein